METKKRIGCDVLVVGGGNAGLVATIEANDFNAAVEAEGVIVVKGKCAPGLAPGTVAMAGQGRCIDRFEHAIQFGQEIPTCFFNNPLPQSQVRIIDAVA